MACPIDEAMLAAVGLQPKKPTSLGQNLNRLRPYDTVGRFVRVIARRFSVVSDYKRGYVSLRPASPDSPIAIFAYRNRIEIAMDPIKAQSLTGILRDAYTKQRTPATTHLIVPEHALRQAFERLVDLGGEAIDWRSMGARRPVSGDRAIHATKQPVGVCPRCRLGFALAGNCGCE